MKLWTFLSNVNHFIEMRVRLDPYCNKIKHPFGRLLLTLPRKGLFRDYYMSTVALPGIEARYFYIYTRAFRPEGEYEVPGRYAW